jgi:tRNA (adenine22-N1)-methyltransferase
MRGRLLPARVFFLGGNMKLSDRLLSCARLVRPGSVAADVGTDHGYLPIYLLKNDICPRVFAADLREMPLAVARRNVAQAGMQERVTFCLSDGVQNLPLDQIGTIICAGMGGDTILHILDAAPALRDPGFQLILQPQSTPHVLRRYLSQQGFTIRQERLSQDGRFLYTAMEVQFAAGERLSPGQQFMPKVLAESGQALLPQYFARVKSSVAMTAAGLHRAKNPDSAAIDYYDQALAELEEMERTYDFGE